MKIKSLSENQKIVLHHTVSDSTTIFAGGAIRSGKSFSACLSFAIWTLKHGIGFDHALCGHSIESVMRNCGWPLVDIYAYLGAGAIVDQRFGTRIIVKGMSIWVIGTSDQRSTKRIQGATLKGLLIDEAALVSEEFFNMAWGRLSVTGAKMWNTYNPEAPGHWYKKKVIDKAEMFEGKVVQFRLRDNPSLDDKTITRFENSYVGHWKARLIEGIWAGATGLIFPDWTMETDEKKSEGWRFSISLDWGLATVFAALGIRSKDNRAMVLNELYYDAREGKGRSEAEHLEALCGWVNKIHGPARGVLAHCDPATPKSFKHKLRVKGFRVRNADNSVGQGLVTTATRLSDEEITIGLRCTNLIAELYSYAWDNNAASDRPTKENDHACDALRYYAYSTGKAYRGIVATPADKALKRGIA